MKEEVKKVSYENLVMQLTNYAVEIGLVSEIDCPQCGKRDTAVIVEGVCAFCFLKRGRGKSNDKTKTRTSYSGRG